MLFAFVWLELVSPYASSPRVLSALALAYTVTTLAAMRVYGRDAWLAHGEAFTLMFDLLGRFAHLRCCREYAQREIRRSQACRAAAQRRSAQRRGAFQRDRGVPPVAALTVLLDGLLGTAFWRAIERWLPGDREGLFAATLDLVGIWAVFLGAYVGACAVMAAVTSSYTPVWALSRR